MRVAALHGVVAEHQRARLELLRALNHQVRVLVVGPRRRCEVRHHHRAVRVPVLRRPRTPSPSFTRLYAFNEPAGMGRALGRRVDRWEEGK